MKMDQGPILMVVQSVRTRSPGILPTSHEHDLYCSCTPHDGPPFHPQFGNKFLQYDQPLVDHAICSWYKTTPSSEDVKKGHW